MTRKNENSSGPSKIWPCLFGLWVAVPCHANLIELPPSLGEQNRENELHGVYEEVFVQEFEGNLDGYTLGPQWELTTEPSVVLEGRQSLKLQGAYSTLQIPASILNLEPEQVYLVEFRYRVIDPAPNGNAFVVALTWPEFPIESPDATGGAFNAVNPDEGIFRYTMRIGPTSEALLTITNLDPEMIVDSLRIYQLKVLSRPAQPNPLRCGFPRLSKFHVYSSTYSSLVNGLRTDDYISTLGLYDMVNGIPVDHTRGSDVEFLTLREINPDIILLPYIQSYMAIVGPNEPAGGSANLLAFFNRGLQEEWFMRKPNGEKLPEILYPEIYQMNHTEFGKRVGGMNFVDYLSYYLSRSVLGSGLWDGMHFDQSEWRTNTLLGDPNPFLGGNVVLPDIDLDEDGIAESEEELVLAWRDAYFEYFDRMRLDLGPTKILFGNPGLPPVDRKLLSCVNGFQFEFFNPYELLGNGDYNTDNGAGWHEYLDQLRRCAKYMQAPQVFSTQFTGRGLGTPDGTTTGNGVPNRGKALESRDFRRMRLGLTTTLLGNGFFGYDLVDNTTDPTIWFDEYAVDKAGVAVKSIEAKGYLGQPLDDATELAQAREDLHVFDFEQGSPPPPSWLYVNPALTTTASPDQVIDGEQSGIMEYMKEQGTPGAFLISTIPQLMPLDLDETYEIVADYRISGFNETTGDAISAGIADYGMADASLPYQVASFSAYDFRENLEGTLRSVATVKHSGASAGILLLNDMSIIVDNVRISKSTGGVFRRDFENGVVLVNPTARTVSIPLSELEGPMQRTGLRRIHGTQMPDINNGLPVESELSLQSGDGMILLADRLAPDPLGTPENLRIENVTAESMEILFDYAGRPPAGFKVVYGIKGGHRTSCLLDGLDKHVRLTGLVPGAEYEIGVRAFDFSGADYNESQLLSATTDGVVPETRPTIHIGDTLAPGLEITLSGENLAASSVVSEDLPLPYNLGGLTVLVNGHACPIRSANQTEVTIVVPEHIAPPTAVLRVVRDGITGPSRSLPVQNPDGGQVHIQGLQLVSKNTADLTWQSRPNEAYWIERSRDNLITWHRYRRVVAASHKTTVRMSDLGEAPRQFYRVVRD